MSEQRVCIVGAGVGGLVAAAELARRGVSVTVLDRATEAGGKMRQVAVAGGPGIDSGPTVFTMRWVFDELFARCGTSLDACLELRPAAILARHAWAEGGILDLHADVAASAAAIERFAGAAEAEGFLALCRRSEESFRVLRDSFMSAQRPSPWQLLSRVGPRAWGALLRSGPFSSAWGALGRYFSDPRLRQLFARYTTYVGSSPLRAPATLLLIAHAEQQGVWLPRDGMRGLAAALQLLGERQGVQYHYGSEVREITLRGGAVDGLLLADGSKLEADAVVFNGEVAALGGGLLGGAVARAGARCAPRQRSLSAFTWCVRGRPAGFPLHYHNVFFADDYAAEFRRLFLDRRVPARPTVYVCAQDRIAASPPQEERLLVLVNAPADGDRRHYPEAEAEAVRERAWALLRDCGLRISYEPDHCAVTTPAHFARRFPASGGALYGRASHGPWSSFSRPAARTRVPGLFLAGGSVHPGPGVPMAGLSGELAANAVCGWLARQAGLPG